MNNLIIKIDGIEYSIETIVGFMRAYNRASELAQIFNGDGMLHNKLLPNAWGKNIVVATVEYAIKRAKDDQKEG